VVSRIARAGGHAKFVKVDVSSAREVKHMSLIVSKEMGPVDILVNNAGVQVLGYLLGMSEKQWDTTFDTNVKGTFLCSRAVVPTMIARRRGSIINIASIAGMRGFAGGAAYSASKAAIVSLTRVMAQEYGKYEVQVNCICPGSVETPMFQDYLRTRTTAGVSYRVARRKVVRGIPLGRIGTPSDIAEVALSIASPRAGFLNGVVFVVDGGATAGIPTR